MIWYSHRYSVIIAIQLPLLLFFRVHGNGLFTHVHKMSTEKLMMALLGRNLN